MDHPLSSDPSKALSTEQALENFLEYVDKKKISLYPAQENAILEIFNDNNIILETPTGSGKSLVAVACHYHSLSRGRRSFYTSPIKALVNEKFFSLCQDTRTSRVIYGYCRKRNAWVYPRTGFKK